MHGRARLSQRARSSSTTAALGAAVVLLSAALASCSSAVEVAPPSASAAPVCARAAWPAAVSGLSRVPTNPEDGAVAAWGDPAVVARCGLPAPAPTTDACVTVDGVDWVVRELTDGTAATTYGRDPAVEVLVPRQYGPVPLLLPVFAPLARTLPATGRRCT